MNRTQTRMLSGLGLTTAVAVFCAAFGLPAAVRATTPEGETLVVTASRLPQPAQELPVSVAVVQAETVVEQGATTLAEALELAPGMSVAAHGGSGSSSFANLQGASSSQVQVLVDGRPVNNAMASVDLSLINLVDVDRVEVVKGPASSLYGANALGGVINVITKRPAAASRSTTAEVTAGGFGGNSLALSHETSLGGAAYLFTGSSQQSDGWRANSESSSYSLTGRRESTLGQGQLSLDARYFSRTAGSPGHLTYLTPDAESGDESLHLDAVYSEEGGLLVRLYHTDATITYDNPDLFWPSHSRHHSVFSGAEARRTFEIGAHRLAVGGEFRGDAATSTEFTGEKTAHNIAVYAEDLYQTGAWSLTAGGRLDNHSVYGSVFSPRVGATYQLGESSRWWASVAKAYRAPSFEDLYWEDPYTQGNPDLRPEKATAYQAGLTLGALDLTAYHKSVVDNIDWAQVDPLDPYTWRVSNLNAARFDGLEATYHLKLAKETTADLSYGWLQALNDETGKTLPKRPTHQGSVIVNTRLGDWNGTAVLKAVGDRYVDAANTQVAKGYTRLDLSATRLIGPGLKVRAELKNALGTAYEEQPGYPMPGASFGVGISTSF